MWRRVVSSSSAQPQTVASTPSISSHAFPMYSLSASALATFKGSLTLSSFHASFASSSCSALATNHEHDEVKCEIQQRNHISRKSATYSGYYSQNDQQWQHNPDAVYADSSRAPRRSVGYGQYQSSSHFSEYQQSSQVGQPAEASESITNSVKGTLEELELFCKEGKVKEDLEVLGLLGRQHIHVNLDQYFQLMHACGEAIALGEAKAVHEKMLSLSPLKVSTYNRILEMYSICGSMESALMVFNDMPKRNMTSWDIMITGLARNGLGEDAIDLFAQFKKAGLIPEGQIFIGVFHACSVVGDAHEGLLHFESMSKDYGIVPTMDHDVGVVHMLGSIGFLDEA